MWSELKGEIATIISQVDSDEVKEVKIKQNLETTRYNNEKRHMKKTYDKERIASIAAGATALKAAKKVGQAVELQGQHVKDLAVLEKEYEASCKSADERHSKAVKELKEEEAAARTLDCYKVSVDALDGVAGKQDPVALVILIFISA